MSNLANHAVTIFSCPSPYTRRQFPVARLIRACCENLNWTIASRLTFAHLLVLLVPVVAAAQHQGSAQNGIVSSNTGTSHFNGMSINEFVGANRFYENGYTGSRAVVGVIEGGHIWNGHETLSHVDRFFDARQTYIDQNVDYGQLGEVDRHATWVASVIGGRTESMYEYQRGVAFNAEIWSGAIATHYSGEPFTVGFGWTRGYAFTDPYSEMSLVGVNGRTADVVNQSFGFYSSTDQSTRGGNSIFTLASDGIAKTSRSVFVASAGNEGENPEVGFRAPGNGYNVITVGALGDDLANPPYGQIASFSSRGPQDYNGPDGFFQNVRACVDIVAPGDNLTLAFYGGETGGNQGGTDPSNGANDWYSWNSHGTSFSAPIVSAGAGLLVDVAYDRFDEQARDGQVIKAVLLNSASKPTGWNNGQFVDSNGVITTKQSLDYNYGAGSLNLNNAFENFTMGTTNVDGLSGGLVTITGWDYGEISEGAVVDYVFDTELAEGNMLTATLNWFVGREWIETKASGTIVAEDQYFTDLRLELWSMENGAANELVALSDADFINTEHFSFELMNTDEYMLRVAWDGERYDFVDNGVQSYGIAWDVSKIAAVPEADVVVSMAGLFGLIGAWRLVRRKIGCASLKNV